MKRIHYIFLAAALLLTGCERQAPLGPVADNRPIEFGVSGDLSVQSKAVIDKDNYTDYGFIVLGGLTVASDSWKTNTLFADRTIVEHDPTNGWTYSPIRYWQPGSYVFAGIMPSSEGFTASLNEDNHNQLTLNFGTSGYNLAENQDDIMVAFDTQTVQSTSSAVPVNFDFDHQLALVNLQVVNKNTKMDIDVNTITVYGNSNTATQAVFTRDNNTGAVTAKWTLGTSKSDESNSYHDVSSQREIKNLLVFPESGSSFTVKVNYTESYGTSSFSKDKEVAISHNWEAGKFYTYTFYLTSDSIVFGSVKVTDWIDGGAADDIPEM